MVSSAGMNKRTEQFSAFPFVNFLIWNGWAGAFIHPHLTVSKMMDSRDKNWSDI